MIAGQNFAASIEDTQDLSTIRGGSLMMRDMVTVADTWLHNNGQGKVRPATLGGSVGIWRLAMTAGDAGSLAGRLRGFLASGAARHLGFGVALVANDGQGYRRQRARLKAAMQRLRLSESRLPYLAPGTLGKVCEIDMVRPAAGTMKIGPGQSLAVSASVLARRRFGIDEKQKLIREETKAASHHLSKAAQEWLAWQGAFAMQINSISEGAAPTPGLKRNLHDKICVIMLDGNGFGAIEDRLLDAEDTPKVQKEFDDALAAYRAQLIAKVFSVVIKGGGTGAPSAEELAVREELKEPLVNKVIRFELLLWGGDEIMFIVPARLGWQVLETLGDAVTAELTGQPVTFSVGAVFCHHDAPIVRIKRLADGLTQHIKELKLDAEGKGRSGKAQTLFMVEVLESFDHVGADLDGHLDRKVPKPTDEELSEDECKAFRALDLGQVKHLRLAAKALAAGKGGDVSRGRLRQTAHALHYGKVPGAAFRGDKWKDFIAETERRLKGLAVVGESPRVERDKFLALTEEYWDYLTPVEQPILPVAGQAIADMTAT